MTETKDGLPALAFASQREWEAWLEENHGSSAGVWLKLAKKNSGIASVTLTEALDTAVCFGWIDSQAAPLDDARWLQRFTPRRPKSRWSQKNRERADRLAAQGRMRDAGMHEVEAAKSDGRWDGAYASQRTIHVPEDLQKRLDEDPGAREFFEGLDSRNRYAILYRIGEAKKPETRARRIEKLVTMLAERRTIY